jgi:ComF family protein
MINLLFALLAPHECLGCKRQGHVLCLACAQDLRLAVERCYLCQRASVGGLTCVSCRKNNPLHVTRALLRYETLAKQVVWLLKFQHTRAAAADIAALLVPLLQNYTAEFYITHAPTANSRIRTRGYDQAQLIARRLARQLPLATYAPLVARLSNNRQVGARRSQRFEQQAHAFRPTRRLPPGSHVVIIDDVITTGATLAAVARALHAAGAARIEALTFAQAPGSAIITPVIDRH